MKVNVIGLGYIGLPTALMLASHDVKVIGTDCNEELVATLNAGKTTFNENGLDGLFAVAQEKGITFLQPVMKPLTCTSFRCPLPTIRTPRRLVLPM